MFIENSGSIIHKFLFTGCGFLDQLKFFKTDDVGSCYLVDGIEPVLNLLKHVVSKLIQKDYILI